MSARDKRNAKRRGLDGTIPTEPAPPPPPKWMQAIVIGGAANGMIIKQMLVEAESIQLSRPEYLKPLAYSKQEQVEAEYIRDTYNVATLWLDNATDYPVPFGLVIHESMTVLQAYSELVRGFSENVIMQLAAENLSQ